jgi:hypothetical protein
VRQLLLYKLQVHTQQRLVLVQPVFPLVKNNMRIRRSPKESTLQYAFGSSVFPQVCVCVMCVSMCVCVYERDRVRGHVRGGPPHRNRRDSRVSQMIAMSYGLVHCLMCVCVGTTMMGASVRMSQCLADANATDR